MLGRFSNNLPIFSGCGFYHGFPLMVFSNSPFITTFLGVVICGDFFYLVYVIVLMFDQSAMLIILFCLF
ncbi:hypothetical protein PROPEN_02504 [Proteus penneri ATCC 35198]|nr:hypothetical protein PROPEN_02504 [Proteus penneri ATCC 35198]